MKEIEVNVVGQTCPVPLVEVRKAIRAAEPGDIIKVVGNHPASKKEIPMAAAAMHLEVLENKEENGLWQIRIKR